MLGALLQVHMIKKARRCRAEHSSKSKFTKHNMLGAPLEIEMFKSARCCRAQHVSKSSGKNWWSRSTFSACWRTGFCTLSDVSQTCGFCGRCRNDGKRGTADEDPQRCMSHGRRSTRDTPAGQGADFLRCVAFLEHQIFLDRWNGRIAKRSFHS